MAKTETRHVDTGIVQRGSTYRFTVYITSKTATSIRDLCVSDDFLALLKRHKVEQHKLQMAIGSDFAHPENISI